MPQTSSGKGSEADEKPYLKSEAIIINNSEQGCKFSRHSYYGK